MSDTIAIQKGSTYYCEGHKREHKGQGYIYNGKTMCEKIYKTFFPKYKKEKK